MGPRSNPGPSANESNALSIALFDLITIGHLEIERVLSKFDIEICLYRLVDVAKLFIVYSVI